MASEERALYRFRNRWLLPAHPAEVYRVLEQLELYPAWWPEVREAIRADESRVDMRARSALPYDLRFSVVEGRRDPSGRLLESRLTGDLEGWSRWRIREAASGSEALFQEEVVTTKRWMNLLSPLARPGFVANHALMMRHGERGLRVFLAGLRLGRELELEAK